MIQTVALAVAEQIGLPHVQRIVHPVDMRRYRKPQASVGEAVGYYVSSIESDHNLERRALSELAVEISASVQQKKARGEPLWTAPIAGPFLTQREATLGSERFRNFVESKVLHNTFSLTNLGPLETLDVDTRYGELELHDLYFVSAGSVLSTLGGAASTFRGELSLLFGGVAPVVPEATTRALSEHAFGLLEGYARGR